MKKFEKKPAKKDEVAELWREMAKLKGELNAKISRFSNNQRWKVAKG